MAIKSHARKVLMKCSNPNCNHSIGLVAHRRGWFGKRLYCSRKCRDDRIEPSATKEVSATYFDWLFRLPTGNIHGRR
jgi:hypothetical protein